MFSLIFAFFLPELALSSDLLTLEKAKEIALKRNFSLIAAKLNIKASENRLKEAKSRFFPKIDIFLLYQRSNSPIQVFMAKLAQEDFKSQDFEISNLNHPDARTNLQTAIEITQPLFKRGEVIIGYHQAKKQVEISFLEEKALEQYILYRVEAAYISWILAKEKASVLKKAVKTAEANLEMISKRLKQGLALRSDLLQAQVHLAALKREWLDAKNKIKTNRSRLNLILGLPIDTEWIPASDPLARSQITKPLAYWQKLALKNRPDLSVMKEKTALSQLEVKKAKWRFAPEISLKGRYEYNSQGLGGVSGDSFTFMAQAKFNLFSGFGDKANLARARAEALAAEAQLKEWENKIIQEVEEAFLSLKTAKAQVEVSKASVAQAEEGLRLIKKRYENGLANIVELLGAETSLKKAELELLTARYRERLAFTELLFRTGSLE
ncbi:hypothetical protein TH606_02270 [Thermodesulfatator autotrophicus]|uniref:Transporter n=1 Tax=Thermodesulfatator autotrophicus TaxID=1795632 RepID=A0A177E9C2_9BACT|nr:hypothetical protein TH606_02270 [Thermodesulfatator autotrophicus]